MKRLLVFVVVVVFIAASVIGITIVPRVYERFGYHPEQNAREWMELPVSYVGSSRCRDCHEGKSTEWTSSVHGGGTVSCEDCHGPARLHLEGKAGVSVEQSERLCPLCHANVLGRPASFPQVNPEEHSGQSPCVQCHSPHSPSMAKPPTVPHSVEGRSDCILCHGATAAKPFPADHVGRTLEGCMACHK